MDDTAEWYHDKLLGLNASMRDIENSLHLYTESLKKPANVESGIGRRADRIKAEKCLAHATRLADAMDRISEKNPHTMRDSSGWSTFFGLVLGGLGLLLLIIGVFVMALSSFWIGLGLSIAGLSLMLIGVLIFAASKLAVLAVVLGLAFCMMLALFIIILFVVL